MVCRGRAAALSGCSLQGKQEHSSRSKEHFTCSICNCYYRYDILATWQLPTAVFGLLNG